LKKLGRAGKTDRFRLVCLTNLEGIVVECSPVTLERAGLRAPEVVGRPIWATAWWDASRAESAEVRQAFLQAARGDFVRCDVPAQADKNGTDTVLLDLTVAPVRGEGGAVAWLLAEGRDLPGELEQTGERYRAFMTATSDVIYQMSPDWTEMRHLLGRDFRAVPGWRSMSIPTIMRGCRGRSRKLSGTRRFLNWNIG